MKSAIFIISLISAGVVSAQPVTVTEANPSSSFQYLFAGNHELRDDIIKMESLLDLVQPSTTDTFVYPETQRHRFPGSDILESAFGLYWEAVTMKREKIVGKVFREISNYKGALKEFDVNFYIIPSLTPYVNATYDWWMKAGDKGRKISKSYKRQAPFEVHERMRIYDDYVYYLEVENTPILHYRDTLNSMFYPCRPGSRIQDHHNFGIPYPSIGVYGPAVLDCNHECKPEIHPYEWLWWLNVNPANDALNQKEWVVGFLRDWSGRFRNWSKKPRKGSIKIPFAFRLHADEKIIELEHLFWDKFVPKALEDISSIPAGAYDGRNKEEVILLGGHGDIKIRSNREIENSGLRYWLSEVNSNHDVDMLTGYLNIAVAVENAYTFKVRLKP